MLQADALAACVTRGHDLATITDASLGLALEPLLGDAGVAKAWVGRASAVTCPAATRIVFLPCKRLEYVQGGTCTAIADCTESLPFVCEQRCDDGDPCTADQMGGDGICSSSPELCDDGDVCTSDACVPGVGCVHEQPRVPCGGANP